MKNPFHALEASRPRLWCAAIIALSPLLAALVFLALAARFLSKDLPGAALSSITAILDDLSPFFLAFKTNWSRSRNRNFRTRPYYRRHHRKPRPRAL